MGREAAVSILNAVAVIENHIDRFATNPLPAWKDPIWLQMSKELKEAWSKNAVYTNVTKNRRKILTQARENNGIQMPESEHHKADTTFESTQNDSVSFEELDDSYEFEEKAKGLDHFKLVVPNKVWAKIIGSSTLYGDGKVYNILKQKVWTDVFSLLIFEQARLPCAYVFDHGKIYSSPDSKHYCRIDGHCSSKQCGNLLFCYLDKNPGDAVEFEMSMRTRETYWEDHDKVYRDLRGVRRQAAGKDVYYMGAGNWQKREGGFFSQFGGSVGPNVPKMRTARRAKSEFVHKKYDVKPTDGKDVVLTIQQMKYVEPYSSFIHEVRRDKFYVSYSGHWQKHAYSQYLRMLKSNAFIGIDGTGSLIQRIRRLDGSQSGHIFLYSITINYLGRTISVHDMLSESQDTDTGIWWLRHWIKSGAAIPPNVSCDRSRALMNAISMAFNDQTIKAYIETLFLRALGNLEWQYRPPIRSYLRNDVAHVMIMVAQWDEFMRITFTSVRQFFLYCVGLMIDSQNLEQFRQIFLLTITVGLQKSEDTFVRALPGQTVKNCREKLEEYIATGQFQFGLDHVENAAKDIPAKEREDYEHDNTSRCERWIQDLQKEAEHDCEKESRKLNNFHCRDFILRLIELAYEFPLWTAAGIPHVVGHSSTACTEGHFNDLKHRVNRNEGGLSRADVFLKRMYDNNTNGANLFNSDLKDSAQELRAKKNNARNAASHQEPNDPKAKSKSPDSDLNESNDSGSSKENIPNATNLKRSHKNKKQRFSPKSQLNADGSGIEIPKKRKIDTQEQSNSHNGPRIYDEINPHKRHSTKAKAKYFRPRTDIQHRNTLATDVRRSELLLNGNLKCGMVSIDRISYFSSNTCGFDSIVQCLNAAITDDPFYRAKAEDSSVETLQFALKFYQSKKGATAEIYKERTKLLRVMFPERIKLNLVMLYPLTSNEVDMFTFLHTQWERYFTKESSIVFEHNCEKCGRYYSTQPMLSANFNVIVEHGFEHLEEALHCCVKPRTVSCSKSKCSGRVQMHLAAFAPQIFIELDIRENPDAEPLDCQLYTIPKYITLVGKKFRLAGVIGGPSGHFIAYCWRINRSWEVCDDRQPSVTPNNGKMSVIPRGAIYIQINDNETPQDPDGNAEVHQDPEEDAEIPQDPAEEAAESPSAFSEELFTPPHSTAESPSTTNDDELGAEPPKLSSPAATNLMSDKCFARNIRKDPDTYSSDNWRNKGTKEFFWVSDSEEDPEEFCPFPFEKEASVESSTADESSNDDGVSMLQSANILPAIGINGRLCHLGNTTAFDSIIHILHAAAEKSSYAEFLRETSNKTSQFIISMSRPSLKDMIYEERGLILIDLYASRVEEKFDNGISVCTVETEDLVINVWEACFNNAPSVFKQFSCKNCGDYRILTPSLSVDQTLIRQEGFKCLQRALQFYESLKKVQCRRNSCRKLCTVSCVPNSHIFIDLTIKLRSRSQTNMKCELGHLPAYLKLGTHEYRLAGVVALTAKRFVAYCLRGTEWKLYDGYSSSVQDADASALVEPHGAIYILI